MNITYWSDYACPYCYIGETRLKKAIAELPAGTSIELEMKSFQLDPAAPQRSAGSTLDRFAAKYGLSAEEAAARIEDISELGRQEGLEFNYATTLFTNTMDAHRLTKYATTKGADVAERLSEALFEAYFSKNLELADHEVLLDVAQAAGLDRQETAAFLSSSRYEDEVRLDEREAARYGVHAVPFFVIGRYGVPGAVPIEQLESVLSKALEEEQAGPDAPEGASCGPDGCRIR